MSACLQVCMCVQVRVRVFWAASMFLAIPETCVLDLSLQARTNSRGSMVMLRFQLAISTVKRILCLTELLCGTFYLFEKSK